MSTADGPGYTYQDIDAHDGLVSIQISYQVAPGDKSEFIQLMSELGCKRQRNGVSFWRIYRDLEQPLHYQERFIVDSWSDYLRQQMRLTVAGLNLERQVRALHVGEHWLKVTHFISEKGMR